MKPLLPFSLAGLLLLAACPDTKVPKAPPKVPEPKAAALALQTAPQTPPGFPHANGRAPA